MAAWKVTWFFRSGPNGWSETLYMNSESIDDVKTQARIYARKRLAIGGVPVSIDYIRISDDAVPGDSEIIETKYFATTAAAEVEVDSGTVGLNVSRRVLVAMPPQDATVDLTWSGLLIRMQASRLQRRSMYLRGVPDAILKGPSEVAVAEGWATAWETYRNELTAPNWAFRSLDKSNTTNPEKAIGGATSTPSGVWTFTVSGHGFSLGEWVRARAIESDPPGELNGLWKVAEINGNQVTMKGNWAKGATYLRGGFFRPQRYAYPLINSILVRRPTCRKPGRPFDSPRGRR